MTKHRNEFLSDLADEYVASAESIDALVTNDEHRETWARLHMARAIIRGDVHQGPVDISASVSAAVAQEPVILAPRHARARRLNLKAWLRPAANVAVAASVALVTVLGVQHYQRIDDGSVVEAQVSGTATPMIQTRPFGGSVNPVSFDAVMPQQVGYNETDIERMRMRLQLQTYMSHHQMQTQWQPVTVSDTPNTPEQEESDEGGKLN